MADRWKAQPHPLGDGRWTLARWRWVFNRHGDLDDDFMPPEEGAPIFSDREKAEQACALLNL